MEDFRIERGDVVMLNSLTDFSEDQGQQDWTSRGMHNTLLKVIKVHHNRGLQQIGTDGVNTYHHAANRFLVEVKE